MMDRYRRTVSIGRYFNRLGRALRLSAVLAAALALAGGVGRAGGGLEGELYIVGSHDSERIERVEFTYDGQNFKVARSLKSHNLRGAGDVQALLNSLRSHAGAAPRRQIRRVTSDESGVFSVRNESGGGATLRIELKNWADVPRVPATDATPELPQIGGVLSGDDRSLSHVAVEPDGNAYYFGEDSEDGGTFGVIDLESNITTRLLDDLPLAVDVADDPQTGEFIVVGAAEIVQIQARPQARIVSRHTVPPGSALESGVVDGGGHLFARRTDGEIVFVDYSASGNIGATGNFTAAARVAPPAAGETEHAALRDSSEDSQPWLAVGAGLAAFFALFLLLLLIRAWRGGRAGARERSEVTAPGGWGGEIVYSRWPEDWSLLRHLVASMSAAERAELGGRLDKNPRMLDDARALIRWPVQGGMSELRGGAAFGAALAGFARGEARVEWRAGDAADAADADALEVRVAHQLAPGALEDWSRVIVEAAIDEAFQPAVAAPARAANDAEPNSRRQALAGKKRKKRKKPSRSQGGVAAKLGLFDIRGLFDRVARRLVEEGAATQLDLDAAAGLRMPGDEKLLAGVLENVLRATLNSERRDGAPPPSLAVMAYEEKGEIHFIALRAGPAGQAEGRTQLTGAALREAAEFAGEGGGRVWVGPGDEAQICRFTLAGKGSIPARRQANKRSGWRPAQPKAVWNMRSQGDNSRF
jgi:hypothetical protein